MDCNDERPDIRPGAPEPFCMTEDKNCDKIVPPAYKVPSDLDYWVWNGGCQSCKVLQGDNFTHFDEVPRNYYDEDCDGTVADFDGDGKNAPEDCNDYDKRAYPGAKEVAGNYLDEDCDGAAVDADGDGLYNPFHVHLAEKLGQPISKFTDCDDYDADVSPANPPSVEAALKGYYYETAAGVRRSPFFCSMFNQDGSPSWLYYYQVRDRNCDGRVTDLDGDGYAAPGDPSLGEGKDIDCDDTDPRVFPTMAGDPTSCVPRADLLNDSVCKVESRTGANGCPVLTMAGTDVVTVCEEGKDANGAGTGIGVCTYPSWWGGNPLVINTESAWGPCDGNDPENDLMPCPAGTTCGGMLNYTPAFKAYVSDTYLDGEEQSFLGTCFPGCTLQK